MTYHERVLGYAGNGLRRHARGLTIAIVRATVFTNIRAVYEDVEDMASTVAFFNNKGGVGKTTLACNFSAFLAEQGRRVLVLDLDPQCNTTQLLLDDAQWAEIFDDLPASDHKTLMGPLRPIRIGDSSVDSDHLPILRAERFAVDVLPGHPSMSALEDILAGSWAEFGGGRSGGARRTMWLRALRESLDALYDYIIVDNSPSLGAINRSALMGSDYFVTPMAADLFSLYALDNIAGWFQRWLSQYHTSRTNAAPELEATDYLSLVPETLPISYGFVGYTVQQYVSRSRKGEIRRVHAYDQHRDNIPEHVAPLVKYSNFEASELDLGTVPNMFSMIPLAQSLHAPIAAIEPQDGLRGAQVSQQRRYVEQLSVIYTKILQRTPDA